MLSDEPHTHDGVYDPDYGHGFITAVSSLFLVVDFEALDDVVYYENPSDETELRHRFTICSLCDYEKIFGRQCGEPCV